MGSASYDVELKQLNYSGRQDGEKPVMRALIAEVGWLHTWLFVHYEPLWVPVVLQWAVPHGVPNTNLEKKQVLPRRCPEHLQEH